MKRRVCLIFLVGIMSTFIGCGSEPKDIATTVELTDEQKEIIALERECYEDIEKGIENIRESLKYPNSFDLKNILVCKSVGREQDFVDIYISYEAENDLGNAKSDVKNWSRGHLDNDDIDAYGMYYKVVNGKDDKYEVVYNKHCIREFDTGYSLHVFQVDLVDYVDQGFLTYCE